MKYKYGTTEIEFDVRYSKRKTIEIGIQPPDIVTVVAPIGIPDKILLESVQKKSKWIIKKLYEVKQIEHRQINKEYVNGEAFMYLGRNYALQIIVDTSLEHPIANINQGKLYIYTPTRKEEQLKIAIEIWYRQKTLEKVLERIEYYQKFFKQKPNIVKVKKQKRKF